MLCELCINDLAIIQHLTISFSSGFNVITGETGAGKSVLIRALSLLLGEKANGEMVRSGAKFASVTGAFEVSKESTLWSQLNEHGIPYEIDCSLGVVYLKRVVHNNGRSSCWVNDQPVTKQKLKEIGAELLEIFAQHEHHSILDEKNHQTLLDRFVSQGLVRQSLECWDQLKCEEKKFRDFCASYLRKLRDADYLKFRHNELMEFAPTTEDYERCLCRIQQAEKSTQQKEVLEKALKYLKVDGQSTGERLWGLVKFLDHEAVDDSWSESAKNAACLIDDLSYSIETKIYDVPIDEFQLDELKERRDSYFDLMRRCGVNSPEELVGYLERTQSDLDDLSQFGPIVENYLYEMSELQEKLCKLHDQLSVAREKAAKTLQKKIEKELSELGMVGSRILINFTDYTGGVESCQNFPEQEYPQLAERWRLYLGVMESRNRYGKRRPSFSFSANKGEPLLPLQKVASGGEASRIMLALKKALADDLQTCVWVFDEIDTGISGRVADMVGSKLQQFAEEMQIICISHLPQVAAYGARHFVVAKNRDQGRTTTSVVRLDENDRIDELARLLSGQKVTQTSLDHATNLLHKAHAE